MQPNIFIKLNTVLHLGLNNALKVWIYRTRVKYNYFVKMMPISDFNFKEDSVLIPSGKKPENYQKIYKVSFFNARYLDISSPPNWNLDPYSNTTYKNTLHWSKIPDFSSNTGDIKIYWELSRFEWLIKSCWNELHDSTGTVAPSNMWLLDWCKRNPPNQGLNWKCAQEASIRSMNVILAWHIYKLEPTNSDILKFFQLHVERIIPTVQYAKAQNNNHGTSEAAALYSLGIMLGASDIPEQTSIGRLAENLGERLLENRVKKLIDTDGTFSQYSVNYQRMLIDTLSFTECIRRKYHRPEFSVHFYQNASLASNWLFRLINPQSGDAPNIGANDGSMLFNCNSGDFRDFRPSCQLSMQLFCSKHVYTSHKHSLATIYADFLDEDLCDLTKKKVHTSSLHKVFKKIGSDSRYAILKCPDKKFRPTQSDALHVDLWHNGKNIIKDSGTYSYNPPSNFEADLSATCNHSTIEIDGRNQMPKISRFLYGAWLSDLSKTSHDTDNIIGGEYRDWQGAIHRRKVSNEENGFLIEDEVEGNSKKAIIYWRLFDTTWVLDKNTLSSEICTISWPLTLDIQVSLLESIESLYYYESNPVPVLAISLKTPAQFRTQVSFH